MITLLLACAPPAADTGDEPVVRRPQDTASVEESICGYVDISMQYVAPGTFLMGAAPGSAGQDEDEVQHQVTLTRGYCISQHEITQTNFEQYAGYNPSTFRDCGGFCPVESVSWHTAAWFTNRMSAAWDLETCYDCEGSGESAICQTRGSIQTCDGFRLPLEAEWEYAARAGETSTYGNGGSLVAGDEDNCDGELLLDSGARLDDMGWYCGNSGDTTQPVARLVPNALYLYDMSGNVAEWVNDWYSETYGYGETIDPWGPGNGSWRVVRGGSFAAEPEGVRVSGRGHVEPFQAFETGGFRVVRTWD